MTILNLKEGTIIALSAHRWATAQPLLRPLPQGVNKPLNGRQVDKFPPFFFRLINMQQTKVRFMIAALFKEREAGEGSFAQYPAGTRIVQFWLHQPTRLTDGHIAFRPGGTPRISINRSLAGTAQDIGAQAAMEQTMQRDEAGMAIWADTQIKALVAELDLPGDTVAPADRLADALLRPVLAAEKSAVNRLSIRWDADKKDPTDAIGLRYSVVQKAEAILNDAGLLADGNGTVIADDEVAATLEVTEFSAAKSLLWNTLTVEERRYNCRISPAP